MNGPDKHHMEVVALDDGGWSVCVGCKEAGEGFHYRPDGECRSPWLTRAELVTLLRDIELAMDQQPDSVSLGYDIECRMAWVLRRKVTL